MSDNQGLILHAVLFLAWSVTVAVSAHRRVRNVVLSTAGAAGVATGTFVVLLALTSAGLDSPESLIALFFLCLFASLVIALITWIAMKLGGWLPKAEDGDDPGRGPPPT
jgi:hypothetical protein